MTTVIVSAGVMLEGGRVLLTQRKAGGHLAGLWELPGGKVEPGEDPRAALVRELDEELGVRAVVGDILEVTFHHYADVGRSVLLLFYEFTLHPDSAAPSARDVAALRMASREELGELDFPDADRDVVQKIRERLSR